MSDDIAAFLTARLDEIEAAANAAAPGRWSAAGAERNEGGFGDAHVLSDARDEHDGPVASCFASPYEGDYAEADAVHIALNDPESTLDGIAGKRIILDLYVRTLAIKEECERKMRAGEQPGEPRSRDYLDAGRELTVLETAVKALMLAWQKHPDYRPEWKP